MANLPESEQIDLLTYEIYDESSYRDDTLIWLFPEEELPALEQPGESSTSLSLDPQDVCGPEPMVWDCALEEQFGVPPDPAHDQSSNTDERLLPPNSTDGDDSVGIPLTSSPLTYKPPGQFNLTRWLVRLAALVSVLLIGSVLPPILERMRPPPVKASAAVGSPLTGTQSAGRPRSGTVRVLTVMAGREETVKDISLRYVGHFDNHLFEEICKLNPDLKDPDHLEDGQLIRIPLRAGTSVN